MVFSAASWTDEDYCGLYAQKLKNRLKFKYFRRKNDYIDEAWKDSILGLIPFYLA